MKGEALIPERYVTYAVVLWFSIGFVVGGFAVAMVLR